MHQLAAHCPGKKLAVILDNASIHVCRYIKEFVVRKTNIVLYSLPTYSPEYNPTEQVWKWMKTRVCGLPKAMNGGIDEILYRIRRLMWTWSSGKLSATPNIGVGIWRDLFGWV